MTNSGGDVMKRRWFNDSMTLLVIRDADQAVKQVNVPKMLIVSVPIAALMSISGLILTMQFTSAKEISALKGQLSNQSLALDVTVKDKEEAIRKLQNEIVRLSAEAKDVKHRVQQMSDLENRLENFVESHLGSEAAAKPPKLSLSRTSWTETEQVGGEAQYADTDELIELARQSSLDLKQVQQMLNTVAQSAPVTLNQAIQKQTTIAGTPSIWPTTSRRLTSSFGYRQDPMTGRAAFHAGIDIGGEVGDPVYAAADGQVITAEFNHARGNYIIIRHVNNLETWYMHLSRLSVQPGDNVSKGDLIGELGSTGRSTGPHLHFQVVQQGTPIDPSPYMRHNRTQMTQGGKDTY